MSQANIHLRKVLIVDDDDMIRELLKHALSRVRTWKIDLLLAEDGEEAVRIVEAEQPDLILLDVLLPKMNGYDVCRQVRQMGEYNPYIIMLTARGNSGDPQRSATLGANDFMTKPFNPSRLVTELNRIWSS